MAIGALIVVVGVVTFDYLRLPASRRLSVERSTPDTLGLGDAADFTYTLASSWPWPSRVQLFDRLPPGLSAGATLEIVQIAADARSERSRVPVTGDARGLRRLGDVALRVDAARSAGADRRRAGRTARRSRRSVADQRSALPLLAMQHRLSDAGIRALKQRGEGNAFAGLRDYVPGDDPRLVDWKATARHARLITREQTIERSQTVISLIDCGRAMTQLAGRFSRFEHVCRRRCAQRRRGDERRPRRPDRVRRPVRALVPPQRGTGALAESAIALSGLDATLTEPDYASAFRMLATRQRRRALVVFFTDVIDVRAAQAVRRLRGSRGAAARAGHRRDPERGAARRGACRARRDRSRCSAAPRRRSWCASARKRWRACGAPASRCSTLRRRDGGGGREPYLEIKARGQL